MDLTLDEDQTAIVDLARRVFEDHLPVERLRDIEAGSSWFARDVWQQLAEAGLIGVGLPEADGGGGFGALGASLVLEEVGRLKTAPPPPISPLNQEQETYGPQAPSLSQAISPTTAPYTSVTIHI